MAARANVLIVRPLTEGVSTASRPRGPPILPSASASPPQVRTPPIAVGITLQQILTDLEPVPTTVQYLDRPRPPGAFLLVL